MENRKRLVGLDTTDLINDAVALYLEVNQNDGIELTARLKNASNITATLSWREVLKTLFLLNELFFEPADPKLRLVLRYNRNVISFHFGSSKEGQTIYRCKIDRKEFEDAISCLC